MSVSQVPQFKSLPTHLEEIYGAAQHFGTCTVNTQRIMHKMEAFSEIKSETSKYCIISSHITTCHITFSIASVK